MIVPPPSPCILDTQIDWQVTVSHRSSNICSKYEQHADITTDFAYISNILVPAIIDTTSDASSDRSIDSFHMQDLANQYIERTG